MTIKFDTKKGAEKLSNFLQKTTEVGKNAADNVQKSAVALSEKMKEDSYVRRMKKYNPLFPDEYHSDNFCIPNMIVIVDDAIRRGIDVCEGAIGWRSNQNGVEVLHLYDEAVSMSGIRFVPAVTCDAVYYVDSFDRNCYIRTDCIFDRAHNERMAELKHIAHMLGAKSCSVELSETTNQVNTASKRHSISEDASVKSIKISSNEEYEQSSSSQNDSKWSGRITSEFKGSDTPRQPKLKWFAHDETIKRLIDARCKDINALTSETIELFGSSSATMSQNTACAIDGAISKIGGVKASSFMEANAKMEHSRKLIFHVQF
jgi:hypothetical protein